MPVTPGLHCAPLPTGPVERQERAQPSLPSPGSFLFPSVISGGGTSIPSPVPCPVPGCQREQGCAGLASNRGRRGAGGGKPPYSSPACCGWSCGVEVTRGDTAAQKAATRTIVGSAEDAGGHAAPNAPQGARHIPGTPRKGTRPGASHARDIPQCWVAQVTDEGTVLMRKA